MSVMEMKLCCIIWNFPFSFLVIVILDQQICWRDIIFNIYKFFYETSTDTGVRTKLREGVGSSTSCHQPISYMSHFFLRGTCRIFFFECWESETPDPWVHLWVGGQKHVARSSHSRLFVPYNLDILWHWAVQILHVRKELAGCNRQNPPFHISLSSSMVLGK